MSTNNVNNQSPSVINTTSLIPSAPLTTNSSPAGTVQANTYGQDATTLQGQAQLQVALINAQNTGTLSQQAPILNQNPMAQMMSAIQGNAIPVQGQGQGAAQETSLLSQLANVANTSGDVGQELSILSQLNSTAAQGRQQAGGLQQPFGQQQALPQVPLQQASQQPFYNQPVPQVPLQQASQQPFYNQPVPQVPLQQALQQPLYNPGLPPQQLQQAYGQALGASAAGLQQPFGLGAQQPLTSPQQQPFGLQQQFGAQQLPYGSQQQFASQQQPFGTPAGLIPAAPGSPLANPNAAQGANTVANQAGFQANEQFRGTVADSTGHGYTIGQLQSGNYVLHDNNQNGKQAFDLGSSPTLDSIQATLGPNSSLKPQAVLTQLGVPLAAQQTLGTAHETDVKDEKGHQTTATFDNGQSVTSAGHTTYTSADKDGIGIEGHKDGSVLIGDIKDGNVKDSDAIYNEKPPWTDSGTPPTAQQVAQEVSKIQQKTKLDPQVIREFLASNYLNNQWKGGDGGDVKLSEGNIKTQLAPAFGVDPDKLTDEWKKRGGG